MEKICNSQLIKNKKNSNSGFALLMAIMVGSLFLAIGATIYRIALVEIILSSTGKDSQYAFYAADSGLECALYWNYKYTPTGHDGSGSAFNVGLGNNSTFGDPNSTIDYESSNRQFILNASLPQIQCLGDQGASINVINFRQNINGGGTAFDLNSNGICATVEVYKYWGGDGNPQKPTRTEIISHGYNTCDPNNPRRVERAIKATLR